MVFAMGPVIGITLRRVGRGRVLRGYEIASWSAAFLEMVVWIILWCMWLFSRGCYGWRGTLLGCGLYSLR